MQLKVAFLLIALAAGISAWPYGEQTLRGVNAGSWLLLEKWITPQVFDGLPDWVNDEYQLTQYLGYSAAEQRLRHHWDTWITEADFEFWARTGINHVRLPIGYWALDIRPGEPWVYGSWDYVLKAAAWCKKYNMQLMVNLHGAPGSQNGNDHSGRSGEIGFFTDDNIYRAVNVIGQIARWSATPEWRDTVTIIQLLNEPVLWGDQYQYRLNRLKDYYGLAYHEVRRYNDIAIVAVHDAFIDHSNWYYLREMSEYYWVMLDTHLYQVFGDEWRSMSCAQHHAYPCSYRNMLQTSNEKLWTIVGEWSLATPAELNCGGQDYFARQQIGAYENWGSGWFMWSHDHAQNWREWSYRHSYDANWMRPTANYSPQC